MPTPDSDKGTASESYPREPVPAPRLQRPDGFVHLIGQLL